jgi:hypothetical protein
MIQLIFSSEAELYFLFYKTSERMVRLLSAVVMLFVSYAVYSVYHGDIVEEKLKLRVRGHKC